MGKERTHGQDVHASRNARRHKAAQTIHEEFVEVVNSGLHGSETLKKLESLQKRRDKTQAILNKDLLKLMDKESSAVIEMESLGREIQNLEYRLSCRIKARES